MFNQRLADAIVADLGAAFPDKVQFSDLRSRLPEFAGESEAEWLKTLDALERDGRIEFKGLRTGFSNALQMAANIAISNAERKRLAASSSSLPAVSPVVPVDLDKAKNVWVVHGRDSRTRSAMFTFLLALGLKPMSFSKAREFTGKPMPSISEILKAAFQNAQAVIVLLTPDDEGRLRSEFVRGDEQPSDSQLTPQARLNVIFEAGMALVSHPEQTIFVTFGYVRPFSDVSGLHYVLMDGKVEQRRELALRLKAAGCPVNLADEHWLRAGDFTPPAAETNAVVHHGSAAIKREAVGFVSSLQMQWESQKKRRPFMLPDLWNIVDGACPNLLELHTRALSEGDRELAANLAEAYQALSKHEGARRVATHDYDASAFITEVETAIARLKSGVTTAA